MGDHEIDVDVSDEYDEENSSQISQTVSNIISKKNYPDNNGRGGKNSEQFTGRKKNTTKQATQLSEKAEQKLSEREQRKIQQQIDIMKKQDKGSKKGVRQQQGNKTPRSDSSVETEQNPKSNKEGGLIQTNQVNSQNSSAGKQTGSAQPLSLFQQQKLQTQQNLVNQIQLKKSQSDSKSLNKHEDQTYNRNSSGLERLVNVNQNSKSQSSDVLNGKIPNSQNNYQNGSSSLQNMPQNMQKVYINLQNNPVVLQSPQNGSFQQLQPPYSIQQYQQFNNNNNPRLKLNYQNSLSSNSNKDFQVIVTEDDSEISASCDNFEDNKSNIGQTQIINNINNINQSNNPGGNDQGGSGQGRRKKTQRKNKENTSMTPQPNPNESNQTNIQVISTEGKQSNKQGMARSNQNIITQNTQFNNNNNSSAAIVSIIPRKQSNQSILFPQQESQVINQQTKQLPSQENCPKTILLQKSINNNVIQLKRKSNEDITLVKSSIPLNQQSSQQNSEEQLTRQIEQQAGSSSSIQQQIQGNIQQTNKNQGNINGSFHNQQSQYHHPIVNPSALPHALSSTHNMINIPSQTNQQNINNSSNNISNSNINNTNTNNSEIISNKNNKNINIDNNNNFNNGNIKLSEQNINSISNENKTKKKRKNMLKEESQVTQQQQINGQYQKDIQYNQTEQKKITILSEICEDLLSNKNSNTVNSPHEYKQDQQNKIFQQQSGSASPVKKNNQYMQQNTDNNNSNNSINSSFNTGKKQIQQKVQEDNQEQEDEFLKKEPSKIGVSVSNSLGIQIQHQMMKEQSNSKQINQIKQAKTNRKNDFEYKQRLKKGPLNLSTFEDQPTLFLKLSDYQEQQKKEKDEVIEKHFEELIESTHSLNGSISIQQMNTTNIFQLSTFGTAFNATNQTSTKPLLSFKQNKYELDKQEILSQDNDSVNKTPAISTSCGNNTQSKSRIRKLDNSSILDKTIIVQDKIIKKFKNSHFPENFKEVFSPLHSDFSSTYLDPSYCSKVVSFFNHQQEFNKIIDKEDEDIDY